MSSTEAWLLAVRILALAVPATFMLGALALYGVIAPRRAAVVSGVALSLAVLLTSVVALTLRTWDGLTRQGLLLGVRVDAVTCVMLLLICGIGLVIVRYSVTYLRGDPGLPRSMRWLLLTLSAVTCLVIANNLFVVALAWTATSLALHQLLTFYSDRTAALVAAHKKFLVSRLGDVCLWSSLALVFMSVGSLNLDQLADWVRVHPQLTPPMHLAAVLVVVAVALKSAQLPFHGWLLQVMEAPTPVSALLHAGVVNIGGLVMIRLAPWLAHAPVAQLLLVVIGLVTTVLAALVMTTRVSVKVALAWSTCAQMGFMLVQCGLGAWHLALLHLVAHSLYKAHAFLSAGSAVDGWRLQAMTQPQARPSFGRLSLGVLVALGGAALGAAALRPWLGSPPQGDLSVPVLAILVSLSMVPMLARRATGGLWSTAAVLARVMAVTGLYLAWHAVAAALVPTVGVAEQPSALGWGLVGGALVALFALKTLLELRPAGRLATALYPWLYAGFYLDERFTRLTFRLWPPRLAPSNSPRTLNLHQTLET